MKLLRLYAAKGSGESLPWQTATANVDSSLGQFRKTTVGETVRGGAEAGNPLVLMTASVLLAESRLQVKPAGPVPEQAGDIVQQEGTGQFGVPELLQLQQGQLQQMTGQSASSI